MSFKNDFIHSIAFRRSRLFFVTSQRPVDTNHTLWLKRIEKKKNIILINTYAYTSLKSSYFDTHMSGHSKDKVDSV